MNTLLSNKELKKVINKSLKTNDIIFRENDICHYVGIVTNGELTIRSINSDGKEIIYAKIKKGQCFGNNLIFSDEKKYKGDVIATKNSEVILLDEKLMLEVLKNNSAFLIAYLNEQANVIKELNSRIKLLSMDYAYERFMFYLKEHNNKIEYTSITSLSKELNIQRETLSRLVSKLKRDKQIIIINNIIKRT